MILQQETLAAGFGREPNSSLALPAEPPLSGLAAVDAFPGLTFVDPVALVSPPGETNRLFVLERTGQIQVITNLANPTKTLFLDISRNVNPEGEGGLLGLAFHPGYITNRWFFVFYTLDTTSEVGTGFHDRLARFETSPTDPNQAQADSELALITQFDGSPYHNGGDIHFGPDGYLYLSLADEGVRGGESGNSRFITKDFFSAILRIDVDLRPGSLPPNPHPANSMNYAIPPDNPFIGATNFNGNTIDPQTVRTEFWAVGLRNPWRFCFDSPTGRVYCGDVGQDSREEIDLIVRGGNYGWNYREGRDRYSDDPPAGVTFLEPIYDYGRDQGTCVIGGVVYRGSRMPQLFGEYIFGDCINGNIWSLHYDGTNATDLRQIASLSRVCTFGFDPANGDILMAPDSTSTPIYRLDYSKDVGTPLPPTLADTGAFANLATLQPEPGIVPYDVNVPFWSDRARKTRWFSVPDTEKVIGFSSQANWSFPNGTVWIKHFEIDLTNGVAQSARRLETRFLVRNSGGIYGITYRWDDTQTNAFLVPAEGLDEPLQIQDGGTTRTQVWHYPARSQCVTCHTPEAGFALGFNTFQLNRDHDYGGIVTNQILALSQSGYFSNPIDSVAGLLAYAHATNEAASLEHRARSYLGANCVQCHQTGGIGRGNWDARLTTPLSEAGIINGVLADSGGDANDKVIKPGSLEHSTMWRRVAELGPQHMPPLATSELNQEAIALIARWITNQVQSVPEVPVVTWSRPSDIVYGTALSSLQLNPSANVPGSFAFDPPIGRVLPAGNDQLLSAAFTPDDTNNYTSVTISNRITALEAPLVITAENKTKVYGQANPPLTASYSGFVNGETASDLDTPVSLSTSASTTSPVGVYPIIATGAADANYQIRFIEGVLTVESNAEVASITIEDGGRIRIRFIGLSGGTYRIESSSNLSSWETVDTIQPDADGAGEFTEPVAEPNDSAAKFYRLAWP